MAAAGRVVRSHPGLKDEGYLAPLKPDAVKAMAAIWSGTNEGTSINNPLEKWQLMLIVSGHEPLDRGAAPYQDAELVRRLRNVIVHFRPEDVPAGDAPHRLRQQLEHKFPENRLMEGSGNPWWPSHCLGHGCAEWAAQSALTFADHVCAELGITPNYQRNAASGWAGKPPGSLQH